MAGCMKSVRSLNCEDIHTVSQHDVQNWSKPFHKRNIRAYSNDMTCIWLVDCDTDHSDEYCDNYAYASLLG